MKNIVMLRLISGDYIIGSDYMQSDDIISIKNAREFVTQMTVKGPTAMFIPLFIFGRTKKEFDSFEISESKVLFVADQNQIDQQIIDNYINSVSGISVARTMPNKGDIIL